MKSDTPIYELSDSRIQRCCPDDSGALTMNTGLLEGNLVKDPDAKTTPKGTPLCTFSVATNRFYKMGSEPQKEVSFFDIETWAGLAERCGGELRKGRGVKVIGRLKQERWVDTEGKQRTAIKIVAEHVEFRPIATRTEADEHQEVEKSEKELAMIL